MRNLLVTTILLGVLAALPGCTKDQPRTRQASVAEAYQDGFRIVVLSKQAGSSDFRVRAPRLAEGEALLKESGDSTAAFPAAQADAMKELLELAVRSPERHYPFVTLEVGDGAGGKKIISVWYHYSVGTEGYSYETDGRTVRPLWSSSHRMGSYDRVEYLTATGGAGQPPVH